MKMNPRVLIRVGVTVFIMVLVMTLITRCTPSAPDPQQPEANTDDP